MTSAARSLADLSAGTIVSTVWIKAPRQRVFTALTTSEVTRWWGGAPYQTTDWQADLKAGGAWRAEGRGADGNPFAVSGVYKEIDPPRTVSMTWDADWDDTPVTLLTYRLEDVDGGTKLTVEHTGFAGHAESCASHASGWEMVLDWLAAYISCEQHAAG
jgi:uncharacterized protein YndB with AHSA1/START domain